MILACAAPELLGSMPASVTIEASVCNPLLSILAESGAQEYFRNPAIFPLTLYPGLLQCR